MKIHTDEDDEFKDERVIDAVNTKNEFQKRGNKDKGHKPSSGNAEADEVTTWKIMNMNERGRERKFHQMDFKSDKAIRLQMVK